ncbi:hypothetical protein LTR50_005897 [Elasticomyces elasticus]|nr:hypothetical protein LTR50_005897 [Elasticomyces elasticus]
MASARDERVEESIPLTKEPYSSQRVSLDDFHPSDSSASTTSLVLEHINGKTAHGHYKDSRIVQEFDLEDDAAWAQQTRPSDRRIRRVLWIVAGFALAGWFTALFLFLGTGAHKPYSSRPHNADATSTLGSGKKVTLNQVLSGQWYSRRHALRWIAGAAGEDGLLLERGGAEGRDYLVVEDVRHMNDPEAAKVNSKTLMESGGFYVGSRLVMPSETWPSPDHKKVLVQSDYQKNWRHSSTGRYWIFDVASQTGEPLDPAKPLDRIQLATWSPQSDAIVFTRENNMFLRKLSSEKVIQITQDGGTEVFYGVPDWVYEEEVLAGDSVTWYAENGKYIAFLRTNESAVPEYPVQYFMSRPSGKKPLPGLENYPEVRQIKYPKAGAPNPIVNLQLYDVAKEEVFSVDIAGDFPDLNRLVTEVVWAGHSGSLLVRETNRESDILKVVLIDAVSRTGHTVRERDIGALDGGWMEVSESTTFVPADPKNGRMHDGYIDTVIHDGYDHLAYFSPLNNSEPLMLTSGNWEVVKAPSAVDLENNLVYFVANKEQSTQRHIYSVKIDGTDLKAVTDIGKVGYYDASFSKGAGFALLSYQGPGIPWQKVINTPGNSQHTEIAIENNDALDELARKTELPIEIYQTINIDGFELNLVERRPPHFDAKKKYPVLFWQYSGPGFQEVDRKFTIDFQSYIASSLGYIVVTLDGRGAGYLGRKTRCIVRGNIGHYEAHDQIAAAKVWAQKSYVDPERLAIWGWSYGGFTTLKTLEIDAGRTFKYGMAVAPVTDWRFYDSVYTERYMHTPQNNPSGYENSSINDVEALGKNVRFLVMHGVADDNVHMQNTLILLDKLDLHNVENYDVHIFPDSDHSIFFHNANRIVYEKLSNWLINAFNGEWLRTADAEPLPQIDGIS